MNRTCIIICILIAAIESGAQQLTHLGEGWAKNSVNVVVFRRNALVSDNNYQYAAYYDSGQNLVLAKRLLGSKKWTLEKTSYKGNAADAHNSISIMLDGKGYLHVAWDHHNNPLNYCRSVRPGSLELTARLPMSGSLESRVTYPEFYRLANGNLLFLYRDGASGNGNLVIKRYDAGAQKWEDLHQNLIDGEGKRNAYWQAYVDDKGAIHISWVWRESPDVASNHDMCYAMSEDDGISWQRSDGTIYTLPINARTAEYILRIPQSSELINQTSMYVDKKFVPYVTSYWRDAGDSIPQYHLLFLRDGKWEERNLGFRTKAFSLSGTGTRRIPVSRPQLIVWMRGGQTVVGVIFRDEERGNRASIAISSDREFKKWELHDIFQQDLGSWEPNYDTEQWRRSTILSLFIQKAEQANNEGKTNLNAQAVQVLEWIPGRKLFQ